MILLAPRLRATSLKIMLTQVGTDCMVLQFLHYTRESRPALVVVGLVFPNNVESQIMVRLNAEGHLCERLIAAWFHGRPECHRLPRWERGKRRFQERHDILIFAKEDDVYFVPLADWIGLGLVGILLLYACFLVN
jgi:hypothetical protein